VALDNLVVVCISFCIW